MGFGDLFKKSFGASAATPVDERALSGTSEDALASSLEKLADSERGWIPLAQAALLFSTEDRQYAFGELDDAGKNRLAMFAADNRCTTARTERGTRQAQWEGAAGPRMRLHVFLDGDRPLQS